MTDSCYTYLSYYTRVLTLCSRLTLLTFDITLFGYIFSFFFISLLWLLALRKCGFASVILV